jgi:hypothetical protein
MQILPQTKALTDHAVAVVCSEWLIFCCMLWILKKCCFHDYIELCSD